jgi:hypothetical protein
VKHCSQCDMSKPVEEFNKCKSKKDGLSSWCRICNREYAKSYSKRNRDRAVKFANKVKSMLGCRKCGVQQDYLIQFHHLESDNKEAGIAYLTQRTSGRPSLKKIKEEMRKCVTLCANHHTEFHYLERMHGTTIEQYLQSHSGVQY